MPEGVILASASRRSAALIIDMTLLSAVLIVITRGRIVNIWNPDLLLSLSFHYWIAMVIILTASTWLYFRLTGVVFSRSLGQRMFSLAIVAEDGSEMTSSMWDERSRGKLLFLIPLFNIYHAAYEIQRIRQRHTHQSNLDRNIGSIVVISNSLPPALRRHLRWIWCETRLTGFSLEVCVFTLQPPNPLWAVCLRLKISTHYSEPKKEATINRFQSGPLV